VAVLDDGQDLCHLTHGGSRRLATAAQSPRPSYRVNPDVGNVRGRRAFPPNQRGTRQPYQESCHKSRTSSASPPGVSCLQRSPAPPIHLVEEAPLSRSRRYLFLISCLMLALGQAAPSQPPSGKKDGEGAQTDCYGDPLPPGAITRLGTVRFRH